jgi:hypothetical protein
MSCRDEAIEMTFLNEKLLTETVTPYQWNANHYHSRLFISDIQKTCIYFAGETGKQRVAFLLN